MAYETLQIDEVCRTCLCKDQDMRSVFSMDEGAGETTRLFEMLMSCASVQINADDGLPAQVCLHCVDNIKRAFSFKQLCESSDHTLHDLIYKSQHNYIEEVKPCVTPALDAEPIPQFLLESDTKQLEDGEDITYEEDLDSKIEFTDNKIDFGIAPREEENEKVVEKLGNSVEKELGECKKLDEMDLLLYPCEHCTACFKTKNDLKVHQRKHGNVLNNKCNVCSREFFNASSLRRHSKDERKKKKKIIQCRYCTEDIATKNFMRHLQRNHANVKEVEDVLHYPKNSKKRRHALALLRNETNFNLYLKGVIRPNRHNNEVSDQSVEGIKYYPCAHCKGLFKKEYLRRHVKTCIQFNKRVNSNQERLKINHLSQSHTITACAIDPTNVISQLNVKEQVFDMMRADDIGFEVKKDLLIAQFGNSYLKKHRRESMSYACSSRMRELARLLINFRNIANNENICLKDLLHTHRFDMVISAVRNIAGYDPTNKTFKSPSLAMHLGTSLKYVCDELTHLILKQSDGFKCQSTEECNAWLQNIKNFKKLIESRWNIELASLAHKDLEEKCCNKPLLIPLVSDVSKFREETLKIANKCKQLFNREKDDITTYKELTQCSLALLIVFNRRRIDDVQFLKIKDYQLDRNTNTTDFQGVLTETERMLTTKYKSVINSGKGSRAVVILIPEIIQDFINLLLEKRNKYIPPDNEYVFAIPGSRIKWGKGDVAIKILTKKMNLENSQTISSNKLRKQIATIMQILNLNEEEKKQFSNFMGHTQKTHEEFYELPLDIYQTGKLSKVLLLMENGFIPAEYKGKSLSQINFDPNLEYVVEDVVGENEIILNAVQNSNMLPENEKLLNEVVHQEDIFQDILSPYTDTDENNVPKKKKKNVKLCQRKSWTEMEIGLVRNYFNSFIKAGTYPSGPVIKKFIEETKIKRTVPIIKSKLQHLIKQNFK